jgi:hypothetical protein
VNVIPSAPGTVRARATAAPRTCHASSATLATGRGYPQSSNIPTRKGIEHFEVGARAARTARIQNELRFVTGELRILSEREGLTIVRTHTAGEFTPGARERCTSMHFEPEEV